MRAADAEINLAVDSATGSLLPSEFHSSLLEYISGRYGHRVSNSLGAYVTSVGCG